MTDFQLSNTTAYEGRIPYFHKLYVDSSHSSPSASTGQAETWEALNQYVPLFSGSYGLPERDPLDELISHRSAVLKAQVEGLVQQLYDRGTIHEHAIKSIDYDTVKVDSELLQLDQLMHWNKLDPPSELSKRHQSLEKELMGLERQRRDEYAGFWKDQVLLRKEMVELAGAFAGAKARESILDGVSDDGI